MEKIYGNVWKPARVCRAHTMQRVFCNQEYSTAVVVHTAASDGDATDEAYSFYLLVLMLLLLNFSTVPMTGRKKSEARFIAPAQAEVSKRQYSSKANSSNVREGG